MLNLDTHILIHALTGSLRSSERAALEGERWGISAIVLWELAWLQEHGRIELDFDSPEFQRVLSRVHIWPLDLKVCRQATRLDFNSDPADQLIAATSIVYSVPLLTRDRKIRKSALVPLA